MSFLRRLWHDAFTLNFLHPRHQCVPSITNGPKSTQRSVRQIGGTVTVHCTPVDLGVPCDSRSLPESGWHRLSQHRLSQPRRRTVLLSRRSTIVWRFNKRFACHELESSIVRRQTARPHLFYHARLQSLGIAGRGLCRRPTDGVRPAQSIAS